MSYRAIAVTVLAMICGVCGAWGAYQLSKKRVVEVKEETASVVVTTADVSRGIPLESTHLTTAEWPVAHLPEGAFQVKEDVLKRTPQRMIREGVPIIEKDLTEPGAGAGLANLIPAGMRAYAIPTKSAASIVAGFIQPGDNVDVLLHIEGSDFSGDTSEVLMQSLQILGVGEKSEPSSSGGKAVSNVGTVTLLVTLEQAQELDLATKKGTLSLALRSPGDVVQTETRPRSWPDIPYHRGGKPSQAGEDSQSTTTSSSTQVPSRISTFHGNERGSIEVK
jgi:pilus assembly protein CpaB